MRPWLSGLLLLLALPIARANDDLHVPPGFVLQRLAETDGQAVMPVGWHFSSGASPGGWTWILSKEDSTRGPYLTGMKIQMIAGIRAANHQTPAEFVEAFFVDKRKSGTVVKECDGQDEGMFVRRCLEEVEDLDGAGPLAPFHILYSFHIAKDGDLVVVSTFGAPEDTWRDVEATANVMGTFRFLGPNFGKRH